MGGGEAIGLELVAFTWKVITVRGASVVETIQGSTFIYFPMKKVELGFMANIIIRRAEYELYCAVLYHFTVQSSHVMQVLAVHGTMCCLPRGEKEITFVMRYIIAGCPGPIRSRLPAGPSLTGICSSCLSHVKVSRSSRPTTRHKVWAHGLHVHARACVEIHE